MVFSFIIRYMKMFGFRILREKGMRVGNHESAIIDLQERVNVLEHNQKVKRQTAKVEEAVQSEIDKVLAAGGQVAGKQDFWSEL